MSIWKNTVDQLETTSKFKNTGDLCRDINECKEGCQPRTNLVKDQEGDVPADSHNIWNMWKKNCFCQLLSVHGV